MSNFKVHTIESAPAESKPLLEASVKGFGMLPNLHGVMAESPAMLEAYQAMTGIFSTKTAFNTEEQTVVWQTINVANSCHYCVPAHTAIANGNKVDANVTQALRNETELPNAKLTELRNLTQDIMNQKGNPTQEQLQAFYNQGYTQRHVLDILVGYSHKIMSNYTNHLAQTPVDAPFQPFAWKKEAQPTG